MKTTKKKTLFKVSGIIAITAAISVGIVLLLQPSKTSTYTNGGGIEYTAVNCTSSNPKNPFFKSDVAENATHSIKVVFENDVLNEIDYSYTGHFNSRESANSALSWLHADYNIYMGKTSVYQEDLSPTFTLLDKDAIINVFIDRKYFTSATAKLVFLTEDEYDSIYNLSTEELKLLYEAKNFICIIN